MDTSSRISKIRSRERERLRGSPWLKVAKAGIPLPPDRTLCPLCMQKSTNPSLMAVSGFVFCYTCVFKYASQYKRCPVTLMPATVDQIRRLFHDV